MADSKFSGDPTEPLSQVRLLSALRSGDAASIHPFLAEISKDRRTSGEGEVDTGAAALHLAVRCATPETVALLLSHRAISPNGVHPPGSGTTPLHLAASLGRADIVNLLLEQENIDDSLVDAHGKTCRDVARNKEIIRIIDDSRSFLNANYRSLLHSYILSPLSEPPSPALISLLESPRIKAVDLSYLDNDSGTSLLHEAARRKDLRLIELAVRAGADVFVRNRRGKTAQETAGKDDRVKVFLRQFANHDKTLIPSTAPLTEPPALKGYLNKYTNVAKGYNTRWFVLKNGVLSYFRHQEDETVASRGSISMRNAVLKVMEKTRFEISTRGQHNSVQKWYMKANHPVEAHRWTEALSKSIEWFKNEPVGGSTDEMDRRKSIESDSNNSRVSVQSSSNPVPPSLRVRKASRSAKSISISYSNTPVDGSPNLSLLQEPPEVLRSEQSQGEGDEEDTSSNDSDSQTPPHENFELHGNATIAQMELTAQLLSKLLSSEAGQQGPSDSRAGLKQSFGVVQDMISEYTQMVRERDAWWQKHLKKEKQTLHFWEESLMTVVKEGENLEKELKARSRKRGSRVFGAGSSVSVDGGSRRRPSVLRSTPQPLSSPGLETARPARLTPPNEESVPTPVAAVAEQVAEPQTATSAAAPPVAAAPSGAAAPTPSPLPTTGFRSPTRSATSDTITPVASTSHSLESAIDDSETEVDSEDEFFDAIDANNIPNLVVPEGLTSPISASIVLKKQARAPYAGYEQLRARLTLSAEDRPNTSLWSVLKHSIGKDLTKISLPVSFNEPTSMLQRMAEDMEFSECLDVAATDPDPLRRLAFVAAFGMSNYSSTLGRIAKPFNPMLSETFEYVRLDRKYRYVSEQVSHHPPISACWAESPLWHYYGEVDAQNKFLGKSFEIRPTGIAHADLLLPEEKAPNHYPKATGKGEEGKVIEHYSWKKVTTNISGFIFGSPTIDHYGDMVVTNHRTGDQCILTFKPRGWRAKDAYEISGQVITAAGEVAYEIAGRWNVQLIARKVGAGHGQLHPDLNVSEPNSPSAQPEYIMLWKNSEKPAESPFNLTPFAITLNHCPLDTLKPYLCPTDCRLRVDQRAFELGQFEEANGLKIAQEERQRAIRKAREEGKMAPHQPRWFMAETEVDTGDRVWSPLRAPDNGVEYWAEREKAYLQGGNVPWKNVDNIFIEEPAFIRELMERSY
ncbi:hypothetical protein EST38_g3497 [Candolleomyces aberdarensis]|uniref:PH domain-containing protein n=1 Tax=Candolleomyces aberdarensis TaxID=2316362 RepID=A0A4Q2DPS0_9AGAR|nr:hypothetical protein EST38_g3497 [Candolleomyces aberdarensis]